MPVVACHLIILGKTHNVKTSTLKVSVWENPEAKIHKQVFTDAKIKNYTK